MRVAILIPAAAYAAGWTWAFDPPASALRRAGLLVDAVDWTAGSDLSGYDLVLPLLAWGYHKQYPEWLRLLDVFEHRAIKVENNPTVLRWNSDKGYLAELADKGVATVPTLAFSALSEQALARARDEFGCAELVIKPTVSASAYGTFRLGVGEPLPEQVRGWPMLVQPWLTQIISSGEYSLIFFGGRFSHAVSKVPTPGEFRVQPEYGGIIERCDPPAGSVELAEAALGAAPGSTTYARVDIVVGNDGNLQIIELELVEPALFLDYAPEAGPAFAQAVRSAIASSRK